MTLYKGALWRPLPENETEPLIEATQLIFHSAVSKADSLWGYFGRRDIVVESHIYVQEDGDAEQYIDWDRQADANFGANGRALSVETWDNAHPDVVPWNDPQLDRLVDIAVQAHRLKGIPIIRAPRWDAPGMGGHTDYPQWSNVRGKTCPGLARRAQVEVILTRARAIVAGSGKKAPGVIPAGPVAVPAPRRSGIDSPRFPLPAGSFFGPKSGGKESVSGYYSHRGDLTHWQLMMRSRGWKIDVDGLYGPNTEKVVRAFQKEKHLVVDGKIGPATWAAAWTASVT